MDLGRKLLAKKVPLSALLTFIKQRNLQGRNKKSGKFIERNRLAFMIQNAIYRNDIRGRHFIEPAFAIGQELTDIYLNNQLLDLGMWPASLASTAMAEKKDLQALSIPSLGRVG
ncbi:hypothetical protein [Hymenobacter sp. YC55]|uniref:hypothetical protein n=1 Tax=Hymenobacter sp. YC55 TaxID=3034019 RepID=UPI0023F63AB9|nr:hypothetical protein [Hymenobacter sp. YC55]MDF7810657.1 hypothetical protein [Hymenobacter sp. YC55]